MYSFSRRFDPKRLPRERERERERRERERERERKSQEESLEKGGKGTKKRKEVCETKTVTKRGRVFKHAYFYTKGATVDFNYISTLPTFIMSSSADHLKMIVGPLYLSSVCALSGCNYTTSTAEGPYHVKNYARFVRGENQHRVNHHKHT